MSDYARHHWLPKHATTPNAGSAQTLTSSYATLGAQFQVASAGQLSVKMRHKATAASQTLVYKVQISDDPIETAEADSVWHTLGAQPNTSGALTEEVYEYTSDASADTDWRGMVALDFPVVAKKARIQVKSAANAGQALATVSFLPLV